MHVLQWLITGLLAGMAARLALRKSRIGLGGDLALGALGGLMAGALLRYVGVTEGQPGIVHSLVSLIGAVGVIAAVHAVVRLTWHAGRYISGAKRPNGLEERLAGMGEFERGVFEKFLRRKPVSRNVDREQAESETTGQRVADKVAAFGGSWAFLGLFAAVLFAWMFYNAETVRPFDPYPFILLNLVLSCIAAVQAPVILMSQNRQAAKDRLHAQADYEVNLKAELEILALHAKLDELREKAWLELIEAQQRQNALLEQMLGHKAAPAGGADSAG